MKLKNTKHLTRYISEIVSASFLILLLPVISYAQSLASKQDYPYKDPALSIEQRIEDLISRMTLEEKIGQMNKPVRLESNIDDLVRKGKISGLLVTEPEHVNELQRIAVEESRLGIPLLVGMDVIHGFATIFPIPLGEASSWDPTLVQRAAEIAASEASSYGLNWTYSPMVDIARDPRWGRIAEGSGEDTYLGMIMAWAKVKGYHGENVSNPDHLLACPKHFAAYGAVEGGRDYNTVEISESTLREIYLPPFKAAIDAGAISIMSAFVDLNGTPASANRFLLTDILRSEWDFKGLVISDYEAVDQLQNHGIASSPSGAAQLALSAGIDMDMGSIYQDNLYQLVSSQIIPETLVNQAVQRILRVKFECGLFEQPYVNMNNTRESLLKPEYLRTARQLACESIVLLKNENHLLPLSKELKTIAVIGPLADSKEDLLGPWAARGKVENVVSILDGIKNKISDRTLVLYAKGCELSDSSLAEIPNAVSIASRADAVILALGESRDMSGEAASRSSLDLPEVQINLAKAIHGTGIPIVVILNNGRPLSIPWISENVPAILETWFSGIQGGNAIADVLFGDYNPGGKLPVTIPRTVGQIPIYYNHKNTGRPPNPDDKWTSKYIDIPWAPLFPFGYGLSYTTFQYDHLRVIPIIETANQFRVEVEVTNSGKRTGDEVVQLYIKQQNASVTRPVKELKGFKRITLKPGEKQTVQFILKPFHLSFINSEMKRVVEPSKFEVMVGSNSVDMLTASLEVKHAMELDESLNWIEDEAAW